MQNKGTEQKQDWEDELEDLIEANLGVAVGDRGLEATLKDFIRQLVDAKESDKKLLEQ